MCGGYPLLSLLPELVGLGFTKPSSIHIKEFGVLFITKIKAVPECFWIRCARSKHISVLAVIRTHLLGTETL